MNKWFKRILIGASVVGTLIAGSAAAVYLPYQGGTGSVATPASGTVLIGNGTGTYTAGNLLCSGGCTITNASGSVTITQGTVATTSITASGTTLNGPTFTLGSTTVIQPFASGTVFFWAFINPGFLSHASITANSPITFSGANAIGCATCIATNTGNWAGTWQGVASPTFYLATNPTGFLNNASITAQSPIVWSNTSTITCPTCITSLANISSTNETISGYLQVSGALTDSSGNKYSTSTGGTVAGSQTNVQYNDGGFAATSSFSYASSTHVLVTAGTSTPSLTAVTLVSASSASFSYTGAVQTFVVPNNVSGSIQAHVTGAAGDAFGGSVTGTIPVASTTVGTTIWISLGKQSNGGLGGFTGSCSSGDPTAGTGGTQTTAPTGGIAAGGCQSGAASSTIWDGAGGSQGRTGNGTNGGEKSWVSATSTLASSTAWFIAGGGGGSGGIGGAGSNSGGAAGGVTGSNGTAMTGGSGGGAGGGGAASFIQLGITATSSAASTVATSGQAIFNYTLSVPATIVGNNNAGSVTAATTMTTSTITFAGNPFARASGVSCTVSPNNATNTWFVTNSTSSFSVTFQNAITANQSFNYICLGY